MCALLLLPLKLVISFITSTFSYISGKMPVLCSDGSRRYGAADTPVREKLINVTIFVFSNISVCVCVCAYVCVLCVCGVCVWCVCVCLCGVSVV